MSDTSLTVMPSGGVDAYRVSTDAASISKAIVVKTAMTIQDRKYVKVEGWQAIAVAHGCTASSGDVQRVDGGFKATGQVRRMDTGAVIAEAEGFVGEDEPVWFGGETIKYGKRKVYEKRPDYAIRAMAQTRAISRACRSAFAHVVVMMDAGLQTTPAEEVPDGGFTDNDSHGPGPTGMAGAGGDFRPHGPRRFQAAGPIGTQAAKAEAERDGLTTAPAKVNAPAAGGDAVKRIAWVRKSIESFKDAQTKDALQEWWKTEAARRDVIETALPTEYERLLAAFDAAIERIAAQAA
ncbi:hypothetical protein [uncultured Bradyrhizobium sp.]|uniref:hypothetical protein n=1 Tax=uncultured Bradyrhizobium sp. TaxID=199684 RepID=UPI002609B319|nr:hypothetical protein [uncultured Bradyrhizobium sp.]